MKNAIISAVLALSFQPALAMGQECADLFAPSSENVRLPVENFQKSEQFRRVLLSNANKALKLIYMVRLASTSQFQLEIQNRDNSWTQVFDGIQSSATLSNMKMNPARSADENSITPPPIASRTMDTMQDVRIDLSKVAEVMRQDAYFTWLKDQGLRYRLEQKDNLDSIDRRLQTSHVQADPVELFIQSRHEGMNPDLALIRVMRNMDPVISPKAFSDASAAIHYNSLEGVLKRTVIPAVSDREAAGERAWLLMPSLEEGRTNLRALLDRQREKYGRLVPKDAYERILKLVTFPTPDINVIYRYRAERRQGMSEKDVLNENMSALLLFAEQLGLARDFPIERLYKLVDRIDELRASSSYESVLADTFDPADAQTILRLRLLTELAQGMSSIKQTDAYLRELVRP